MKTLFDKEKILTDYNQKKDNYTRLGQNLVEALKTFLKEKEIPYLDVYFRIKKFDSFYEKIGRKEYSKPFEEIEDFCGVRIICYYASDIEKISSIINKEFQVIEQQNKSDLLGLKEFAYRSTHFIVKIFDSWNAAPNYRGLEGLKCEIQVRTILMHAWAEIEHKLNYKSDAQVPGKFQRKLYLLSAKFEEADEQFEELRIGVEEYKRNLLDNITKSNTFDINQDFNIDSYNAYIKYYFPKDKLDHFRLDHSFETFSRVNKNFQDIDTVLKKMKPFFKEIKSDLINSGYDDINKHESNLIAISMDVLDDEYYNKRKGNLIKSWDKVVQKWREKLRST